MNKKLIRDIAIAMIAVFAITVIVYPLIFGPEKKPAGQPPVELEVHK